MACTARDRKFKTYLYPGMFSMVLFGIMMMVHGFITGSEQTSELGYITGVIMAGMSGVLVFKQLLYTGTPAAAWVYSVVPLKMRAQIFAGSIKAVFLKFFLPVHLLLIFVTIWLAGPSKLLYALTGLLGTYLLSIIIIYFQGIDLPYTKSYEMFDKGEITVTGIFAMILAVLLIGLVYKTTILPTWVLIMVIPAFIGFSVLVMKKIRTNNK